MDLKVSRRREPPAAPPPPPHSGVGSLASLPAVASGLLSVLCSNKLVAGGSRTCLLWVCVRRPHVNV